jgi:FKBP-type peptidyl-prolyl cis-trans isomerase FkpA
MKKHFFNLLTLLTFLGFAACVKSDAPVPTPAEQDAEIKAYIAKKGWSAQATTQGVYYVIDSVGTGATPLLTDYVNIKFKGYLLNETLFSNSKDSSYEFKMNTLIEGLQIGLQKFKVGGKGKILIPSAYAFGTQASNSVPANSIVVFEIELKSAKATNYEDDLIKAYITKKGWTAEVTPEGVYYVTDVAGTGANPALNNSITVFYKGYLLDEKVFDSRLAPNTPVEFALGNLIKGWQIGFQKFKAGGKGKLLIPSAYGYGSTGTSAIPPNSPLVFEVELVSFR